MQARTAPTLALAQTETVASLVEVLGWELVDRQSNVELSVRLGPGGIEQQGGPPQTVWVLAGPGGQFRAVLSQSSVAVECGAYSQWADFRAALAAVLGAVAEVAAPGRVNRFGVRYVNQLDGRAAFRRGPRGPHAGPGRGAGIGRRGAGDAGHLLAVGAAGARAVRAARHPRHGMTAPGRYLLDFDAYNETTSPFDPSSA